MKHNYKTHLNRFIRIEFQVSNKMIISSILFITTSLSYLIRCGESPINSVNGDNNDRELDLNSDVW